MKNIKSIWKDVGFKKVKTWADLHIHTLASDGIWSPRNVIDCAQRNNLSTVAITDHDTIDVKIIEQAQKYGLKKQIRVIPGLELTVKYGGSSLHLLGYFFDKNYKNPALLKALKQEAQKAREERNFKMVERLNKLFGPESKTPRYKYPLKLNEIKKLAGNKNFQRTHISLALEKQGLISLSERKKILGKKSPAYVAFGIAPKRAKELFEMTGAFVCLAHPASDENPKQFTDLIKNNLKKFSKIFGLGGVEVFHPRQSLIDSIYFIKKAKEIGLLMTAGSDSHNEKNPIGSFVVPNLVVQKMEDSIYCHEKNK